MPLDPMVPRRRRTAIFISLLAHAALGLWLLTRPPRRQDASLEPPRAPETRVVFVPHFTPRVAHAPGVAAPSALLAVKTGAGGRRASSRKATPDAAPSTAPEGSAMREGGSLESPRQLRLPSSGQLARLAGEGPTTHPPGPPAGDALQASLAADKSRNAARSGPRSTLVGVGHLLARDFTPTALTAAAALGKTNPAAAQLANELAATTKPVPIDHLDNDLVPAARAEYVRQLRDKARICIGACGQSHAIAEHLAVIRFEHDAAGQTVSWRFRYATGVPALDQRIADIAARAARLRFTREANEPVPEWSEWGLAQTLYRWSAAERLLDPAFTPPGVVIPELSGVLPSTSVTTEAKLIAVAYRPAASQPR